MNSYNENLNATVVASLQALDLDEKNLKSQLNASMFTLYHAEGATITADDKLTDSKADLKFKNSVKQIAVINTNISNNLVSSATQADQYLKQAITNAAVGASNVQIAANAIVRLASDIGSIFSIVNAADFDTDVFHQAETVASLMNDTAYEAEVASQIAMDASTSTSQVTSSIVLDKAKTTNASIKNLLKITSADYDAASQTVIADNATQAAVSASEKVAEGALEDVCIDYLAAKVAYYSTNSDLNLNLLVNSEASNDAIDDDLHLATDSGTPGLSFDVSFNLLKTPFNSKSDPKRPTFPIENYYVFVVKESKKLTFSVSNAEALILSGTSHQYIPYPPELNEDGSAPGFNGLKLSYDGTKISGPVYYESEMGKDERGNSYTLCDSDNDVITVGEDYVVFVMGTYYNDYKKMLNDFDDFLSAPSKSFCMKNKLQAVKDDDILIATIEPANKATDLEKKFTDALSKSTQNDVAVSDDAGDGKLPAYSMQLTFDVNEYPANNGKVEYRCIFLPEPDDIAKGMLTKASLKSLIDIEYLGLQSVEAQNDSKISELENQIAKMERAQTQATAEYSAIDDRITAFQKRHPNPNADQKKEYNDLKTAQKGSSTLLQTHARNLKSAHTQLDKLKGSKKSALQKVVSQRHSILGFFFNLPLAEQVSAGNYSPAIQYEKPARTDAKPATTTVSATDNLTVKPVTTSWTAFIGPNTTDNFGNLLVDSKSYIPVVVSIAAVSEDKVDDYANAISDFEHMKKFEYKK